MSNNATTDADDIQKDMTSQDPFASQREPGNDPFHTSPHGSPHSPTKLANISGSEDMGIDSTPAPNKDRRMSKEWDASKVPPSRFQRREGSIHATPASRDAHVKGSGRDKAYFDKLKEKGWDKLTRH